MRRGTLADRYRDPFTYLKSQVGSRRWIPFIVGTCVPMNCFASFIWLSQSPKRCDSDYTLRQRAGSTDAFALDADRAWGEPMSDTRQHVQPTERSSTFRWMVVGFDAKESAWRWVKACCRAAGITEVGCRFWSHASSQCPGEWMPILAELSFAFPVLESQKPLRRLIRQKPKHSVVQSLWLHSQPNQKKRWSHRR